MTETDIQLFLRIYDRCLKYGETNPKYAFPNNQIPVKDIFEKNLRNNNLHMAMYVFSGESDSKAREVFLYFLYRLNFLDEDAYTNFLFSVYNMPDTNTSFFNFFSHATITDMFQRANTPFCSKDLANNFEDLDDEFTVYRGIRSAPQDISRCGYSWTLRRKLAKDFAFQVNTTDTGFIISGQVCKENILGYLTNRGELEIVIPANLVRNKVITRIEKSIEEGNIKYTETIITD